MKNAIINLLDSITAHPDQPKDLAAHIEGTLEECYPPPHITWTLIAFFDYCERKKWVREIIEPLATVCNDNDSGTSVLDCAAKGVVPNHPEWEYKFDGSIGYVRNRITCEIIVVDLSEDPHYVWLYQFVEWLRTNPTPVAQRVTKLYSHVDGVGVAIDVLVEIGLLHRMDDEVVVHCGRLDVYEPAMRKLAELCRDRNCHLWMATLVRDWPLAFEVAMETEQEAIVDLTKHRANECCARWIAYLVSRTHFAGYEGNILYTLADAKCPDLFDHVKTALANDQGVWAAVDIIGNDPSWCSMVYAYFVRSEYCRARCAKYLVRHDYRSREVIGQLAGGDDLYLEVVLELVVEHAPEMLQRYIPRALKSSYRQVRLTAAAILALLDSSWSYSQLIDVLETSNDLDATIECRAALRESTTPAVRTVPVEWEKRHPDTNGGPFLSDRSIYGSDSGCEQILRLRMCQLFDRVMKVRQSLLQD